MGGHNSSGTSLHSPKFDGSGTKNNPLLLYFAYKYTKCVSVHDSCRSHGFGWDLNQNYLCCLMQCACYSVKARWRRTGRL